MSDARSGRPVLRITGGSGHAVHGYYDLSPWNPGMTKIVFSRRIAGTAEGSVLVVDADGNNLRELGTSRAMQPNTGCMPQWAPDGRRVYFTDRDQGRLLVRWVDVESDESGSFPGSLRMIRPDGQEYASHTDRESFRTERRTEQGIFTLSLRDGTSRLLASVADCLAIHPRRDSIDELPLFVKHTKWSPDGSRLMFAFSSGKQDGRPPVVHELYVVGADGSGLTRLGPFTNHPSWHPDGLRILTNSRLDGSAEKQLVLTDAGTGARELVTDRVPGMGHPSYSPDGEWILLDDVPARRGPATLKVVNPGSGEVRDLVVTTVIDHSHDGTHLHPVWSPDGRQILYASDASGVSQLCVIPFP